LPETLRFLLEAQDREDDPSEEDFGREIYHRCIDKSLVGNGRPNCGSQCESDEPQISKDPWDMEDYGMPRLIPNAKFRDNSELLRKFILMVCRNGMGRCPIPNDNRNGWYFLHPVSSLHNVLPFVPSADEF
jgi:hypothetical protein